MMNFLISLLLKKECIHSRHKNSQDHLMLGDALQFGIFDSIDVYIFLSNFAKNKNKRASLHNCIHQI